MGQALKIIQFDTEETNEKNELEKRKVKPTKKNSLFVKYAAIVTAVLGIVLFLTSLILTNSINLNDIKIWILVSGISVILIVAFF
ncbi:MAG: hypothetical protein H6613_04535 [Ignavibacteriales bacterium]|nr:hypothetical protein [Ignavibacteriales bacterium]